MINKLRLSVHRHRIQGDHLYMSVLFCDASIRYCTYTAAYNGQVTFYKVPAIDGHVEEGLESFEETIHKW